MVHVNAADKGDISPYFHRYLSNYSQNGYDSVLFNMDHDLLEITEWEPYNGGFETWTPWVKETTSSVSGSYTAEQSSAQARDGIYSLHAKASVSGSTFGSAGVFQDMLWEVQPITVGREAIAQFTVRLSPGPRVTGQLDIRADDPKPFSKEFGSTVISFQPSDGLRLAGPWSSRVQADGTFASDNLPPGSYFMTVTGLPPGWSFVSAEVRGRDYSLESFEAAEITGPVSIVIERAEAVASGAVSGLSGDSRCTVLVFPTNRSLWTLLPGWQRRFRSGTVAPSGTYRISGLVAGEYWMVAVIGGDAERLADPSYLGMLTGKSTRVTIERGKSLTVALQAQR